MEGNWTKFKFNLEGHVIPRSPLNSSQYGGKSVNNVSQEELTSTSEETFNPLALMGVSEYIRIAVYIIIFVVCVVGNALVIVTLLQNRKMRTVTNIFLINLSVADLLLGVFCMPVTLTGQLLKEFIFGAVTCAVINYFQIVSVAVSTFTLLSISVERYFAICCPLTSRRWQTVSHSIKMTILCWILALVVVLPVIIYTKYGRYMHFGGRDYYYCREKYPSEEFEIIYNSILICVLFGFPGVFMILAYAKITYTLYTGIRNESRSSPADGTEFSPTESHEGVNIQRSGSKWERWRVRTRAWMNTHSGQSQTTFSSGVNGVSRASCYVPSKISNPAGIRNTNSQRNLQAKKRIIVMLIVVVCEFFISFTPIWIVNFMGLFVSRTVNESMQPFVPYLQLLMYTSTCCNPITYCFLHSKFRQGFIQAFTCKTAQAETTELTRSTTAFPRPNNTVRNIPRSESVVNSSTLQLAPKRNRRWQTMDSTDEFL